VRFQQSSLGRGSAVTEKPTEEQLGKLHHALGINYPYQKSLCCWTAVRNYFCAEAGDADMEALVSLGLMFQGKTINEGRDAYYHATLAGERLCGVVAVKL
jgi:hypothetical protein